MWEELLPHIEFSITSHTPFEVVYGFNPLTPLGLLPILVLDEVLCKDGFEKSYFIKNLHKHIKRQIERKIGKYAHHANKELCETPLLLVHFRTIFFIIITI